MSEQNGHTPLLTVQEVAERLRVDATTVRRWIKSGALPAIPLPHPHTRCVWRVRRDVIDAIIRKESPV